MRERGEKNEKKNLWPLPFQSNIDRFAVQMSLAHPLQAAQPPGGSAVIFNAEFHRFDGIKIQEFYTGYVIRIHV